MTQLTFHQTLEHYDGTIEFYATDQHGNLYIATTYNQETPARDFIAVPVSAQQRHDLANSDETDLRDLMLENGQCQWFLLTLHDDWSILAVEQDNPIAKSGLLPESDFS